MDSTTLEAMQERSRRRVDRAYAIEEKLSTVRALHELYNSPDLGVRVSSPVRPPFSLGIARELLDEIGEELVPIARQLIADKLTAVQFEAVQLDQDALSTLI